MFPPDAGMVLLRCDNCILDDVIERFDADVWLIPDGDERFYARIKSNPGGLKFWLLQYLEYCEVLEPMWLREEMVDILNQNQYVQK